MKVSLRTAVSCLIVVSMCFAGFALTGCSSSENSDTDASEYDFSYTDRDLDPSYDKSSATVIELADDGINVKGDGAETDKSTGKSGIQTVNITKEGTYILSGTLSDGQIIVETPDDEKVQLVLDGVSVASSETAPLHIKESDKVFITLADESDNTFTGPVSYSDEASENNIDGVIFSKADLTINGDGSLSVTASAGHGIVSKDDLVITGGTLDVTAPGDGLQGKDCVKIKDGTITIDSENDGIRSSNSEDAGRGFITVDGGKITVDAGYDGLQAATVLRIADGELDITTGGGSEYASTEDDWGSSWGSNKPDAKPDGMGGQPGSDMGGQPGGNDGMGGMNGGMNQPDDIQGMDSGSSASEDSDSDTASAKGLKANIDVLILGGTLDIDSSDDAVHSNGDVHIKGGSITASTGDDGVHADSDLVVSDGSITISQSYEGLEGNTVTINDGNIDIVASDDGLNAAGGKDGSSTDGRAGQNDFAADESAYIEINGGTIDIAASGDGIDSNGSLTINNGIITVTGPTQGDTSVIDYETEGVITGGMFIGTGAMQMAQTFSSSEQGVIAINSGEQTSGTAITLKDSSGKTVMSHTAGNNFALVILSSPDIVSGETYTVNVGSASGQVTAD